MPFQYHIVPRPLFCRCVFDNSVIPDAIFVIFKYVTHICIYTQHRNKHANSCRLKHIATGLVTTSQTRSRVNSYANALQAMESMLQQQHILAVNSQDNLVRKNQIGSGQRGDKIRTIRFQDDQVVDHRNGKTISARDFMMGKMHVLWER